MNKQVDINKTDHCSIIRRTDPVTTLIIHVKTPEQKNGLDDISTKHANITQLMMRYALLQLEYRIQLTGGYTRRNKGTVPHC